MDTVLSIKNLSKHYGRIKAVDNLSLEVKRGSVYGILGPNGSGKTTTLGVILSVINQTSGDFQWFGQPATQNTRKKIGAILEHPIFYPYLTAVQNLKIVCDIKEVPYARIDEVLEQVGLAVRKDHKFKTFSLGMKQRLSIASALLCDPEVMILDEPTNGLDPQGIAEIRDLIIDIANSGKTIIVASHLLDEVQRVCTHFCVLQQGKLIHDGLVEDVGKGATLIEVKADADNLQEVLESSGMASGVKRELDKYTLTMSNGYGAANVNEYLFKQGITAKHLIVKVKTLEKQFLEILAEQEGGSQ
ncbi:ABC transporter ATP-binding protein [Roseivirga sp. 4D4]|uniref:ABC transporter ATP-binding protein n=1 Tax=Roseivirga sp. 4D4 TaxID=1889784 RepID=UPI0008535FFB|nr:ATP-binding cassette domain-containing protein [Roseivirga sp. 4D4]OEK01495.1 ABC transporter ATP-binding protein [Roseivirga sp. 4D4]